MSCSLPLKYKLCLYIKTCLTILSNNPNNKQEEEQKKKMTYFRPLFLFLLTFFVLSSALDMSIISYDEKHADLGATNHRTDDEVKGLYESWIVKHGKNYNAIGEKEKRFEIFKDNLRFIDEQNAETRPYKLGLNRFSDLTNDEYRALFVGGRFDKKTRLLKNPKSERYAFKAGEKLPESVDWRQKGAVAPVKDQGQCGEFFFFFLSVGGRLLSMEC